MNPQTWPLNESHFSCEHPLILNYVLHDLWGSQAFVGSDYPATHSTSGILQGEDQEMPTQTGFFAGGNGTQRPDRQHVRVLHRQPGRPDAGLWDPACTSDSSHVGGLPNGFQGGNAAAARRLPTRPGRRLHAQRRRVERRRCRSRCSTSRWRGSSTRSSASACSAATRSITASCTNPGGVGGRPHRHRAAAARRRRPARHEVRRRGDRREVLRGGRDAAQERRQRAAADGIRPRRRHPRHRRRARTTPSPTRPTRPRRASSTATRSTRWSSCKEFSGKPERVHVRARPTTRPAHPVPCTVTTRVADRRAPAALRRACSAGSGLQRASGPPSRRSRTTASTRPSTTRPPRRPASSPAARRTRGAAGSTCRRPTRTSGRCSTTLPNANVTFDFDNDASPATGAPVTHTRANAPNVYGATTPGTPTNAGYTQALLTNQVCSTGTTATTCAVQPTVGWHAVRDHVRRERDRDAGRASASRSRASRATMADAAAAAAGKSKALVFVNTGVGTSNRPPRRPARRTTATPSRPSTAMSAANVDLINAVAAANPNTIVVINNDNPVDTSWIGNAKSVLDMWFAGQEGGTSTARHPARPRQPERPHGADVAGQPHRHDLGLQRAGRRAVSGLAPPASTSERLNGNARLRRHAATRARSRARPPAARSSPRASTRGYRYFDKLGITPQFPFGYGLSYTSFAFSGLRVAPTTDGGAGRDVHAQEHRLARGRRRGAGLRRAAERRACGHPVRRPLARAVRPRRAGRRASRRR